MERAKLKKYDLDKTDYGVVIDCEDSTGFPNCLTNLEKLLVDIYKESNSKPKLSTKLLVLKSKIGYNSGNPYRYSKDIVKNITGLLKEYESWNQGKFDLEKVENKREFESTLLEKERERIDAWGPFMYVTMVRNDLDKIKRIVKETKNKTKVKEKVKKQRLSYTYKTHYNSF